MSITETGQTSAAAAESEKISDDAIVVEGLTKSFGDLLAVDDVTFRVPRGQLFGFLGPNGAGKSTTMKAMLGLLSPDSGVVTIGGENISDAGKAAKAQIGYLPERLSFYDNLTPVQTLEFFADLKGVDVDAQALLDEVGLEHAADRRVGSFSKGMTQLLGLAQAMIGNPSIYILDEPLSGLDPRWVVRVREKIRTLNEAGATVFLSSHNLAEVQELCDHVTIIDDGRLVATDTVEGLSEEALVRPRLILTIPERDGQAESVIDSLEEAELVDDEGDTLTVSAPADRRAAVIAALVNDGVTITNVRTHEPSLEDAFVELVTESEEAGAR